MRFELEFSMDGADFDESRADGVEAALQAVLAKVEEEASYTGDVYFDVGARLVLDSNGNRIGEWRVTERLSRE